MRLLPYGPRAVLAEFDTLTEVMSAAAQWRESHLPGVVDVVPAARTVLVVHDGSLDVARLVAPAAANHPPVGGELVTLDVVYDGDDLVDVARAAGLSEQAVIDLHCSAEYTVAFCGFMPGFGYLVGLPQQLQLARRSTPRTRVSTGSVAIAAEFAGVYPRESPGGWHLLGHTAAVLWDDSRTPPALLVPGTRVRFRST
jgi:KipI family sensor histidine kinase inhibitor